MGLKRFRFAALAVASLLLAVPASAEDIYNSGTTFIRGNATDVASTKAQAEQGEPGAQFELGSIYLTGVGATADYALALKWFQLSAEKGNAQAQYNLGSMYSTGTAIDRDFAEAYKWYSIAAVGGDQLAIAARDSAARQITTAELAKAQTAALEWLVAHPPVAKAQAQAHTQTQTEAPAPAPEPVEIVNLFMRGDSETVKSLKPLALQGDAEAQYALGQVYLKGRGAPMSYAKALTWFTKSAEQGYVPALYSLGEMYVKAQGVKRNFVEAYKWYSLVSSTDLDLAPSAGRRMAYVADLMPQSLIIEAQKRAQDWMLIHQ